MKRYFIKKYDILYVLLVIIWMMVIFWFSSMPSEESNSKSTNAINKVIKETVSVTNNVGVTDKNPSDSKMTELVEKLNKPLRKCMHASVYFVLSLFILLCLRIFKINHGYIIAIIICFIYACTDEFHQLFVIGRTGQFIDVLIDTFGSVIGVLSYYLAINKIKFKYLRYILFCIILIFIPIFLKLFFIDYDSLLGYIGSIIGGLITLEGVRLTIKGENDNRKKDLKLMYLPVLKACVEDGKDNYTGNCKVVRFVSNSDKFIDTDCYDYKNVIKLSNVGRGEIFNLNVKLKDYELISSIDSKEHFMFVMNDESIKLLPIGESIYLLPEIPIIKDLNNIVHLSIILNIEFEDIFKNKYYYDFRFVIYVSKDNNKIDFEIFNTDMKLLNEIC